MDTHAPADGDAARHAPAADRAVAPGLARRRFLRVGAVPVTMTLAARPVRAWHCNTSSAWGSQLVNPNASTSTRNAGNAASDESWTINNWCTDTSRAGLGTPWARVKSSYYPNKTVTYTKNNFSVAQLFSGMAIPAGLAGSDKVFSKLNSTATSEFAKYMMVARLNSLYLPAVASCLRSNGVDQLPAMIDGSYLPPTLEQDGVPWNKTTIIQYLRENWLVVPS